MRRERYELTVGKPQVVTRGGRREGLRAGRAADHRRPPRSTWVPSPSSWPPARAGWSNWSTTAPGWIRMEWLVPARGPDRLPHRVPHRQPRGTGILHHVFDSYEAVVRRPAHPGPPVRWSPTGPARRPPTRCSTSRSAASLFVEPMIEVYEGMIVGENSPRRRHGTSTSPRRRSSPTSARPRARSWSGWYRPAGCPWSRRWSFCREDECVEVTAEAVRLRKVVLDASDRGAARPPSRSPRDRFSGGTGADLRLVRRARRGIPVVRAARRRAALPGEPDEGTAARRRPTGPTRRARSTSTRR